MLEFTDTARAMVRRFAESLEDPKVRVTIHGSPFAPQYEFALVEEQPAATDRVVELDGFKVLIDEASAARMEGSTVDWVEGEAGTGFEVRNPNARKLGEAEPTGDPVSYTHLTLPTIYSV